MHIKYLIIQFIVHCFIFRPVVHLPEQMQAMGISGSKKSGFRELFATHPSLDDRITALRGLG